VPERARWPSRQLERPSARPEPGRLSGTADLNDRGGGSAPLGLVPPKLPGEVLERRLRLRLLLSLQVDALSSEIGPCFGSNLERFRRRALGGQFEDSLVVGIQPDLGDEPAAELLR